MTTDRQQSALAPPPEEAIGESRSHTPRSSVFVRGGDRPARRCGREARSFAARLGQLGLLVTLALGMPAAWAEPAAPIAPRVGNHPGFGRMVFDFPARIAYQQVRTGDTLSLRFAADVTITPPAHPPHNVDAVSAQPGVVDLGVVAGATTHVFWLDTRLVVDVYDPTGTATQQPAPAGPASQGTAMLARPTSAPSSDKAVIGPPTQKAATLGAPTAAPAQAVVASRPVPLTPAPAPAAPPAPLAAAAATHVSPTTAPVAQTASASPIPPSVLSPLEVTPAGTSPGTPARQTANAPGHPDQPVVPVQAVAQLPDHVAARPPDRAAVQPPDRAAVQPPDHAAVYPPDHAAVQPPDRAAVQAPDHTAVQPAVQAPSPVATPVMSLGAPAGPFALAAGTTDTPQRIGMVLALPFPTSVGVAAFRRGDSALVVFDERRPIDLAAVRGDPVFGAATVELLPGATVLRLKLPADRSLEIGETQQAWRVGVVATASPARPIPMRAADGQVSLPADAPGAVVTIPDPDTGASLLVGTQRATGQDFPTLHQTPEFSLLPTWQGVVVEPLADSLAMRGDNAGFLLTGGGQGLAMAPSSTTMQAQTDAAWMTRRFDLRSQPLESLVRRLHREILATATAPPRARGALRQKTAATMIALGLGAEAQAMLRLAAADDPAIAASADAIGLNAIAALLAGRVAETDGIEDPRLSGSDEVTLWRAVRAAQGARGSPLAAATFAVTTPLIAIYPTALRERLLPLAFETMIEGGQTVAAARLLAHQPDSDPTLALAHGMLRAANGDIDGALAIYDRVATGPDRLAHAKAAVRAVELRLSAGRLDTAHAADDLERLLYAWRGGARELALRERIAGLREQAGDWTAALAMLHETETLFPDAREAVHAALKGAFTRLLQDKALDRLAPLELVSMVAENADLLPEGPAGEPLEERLADRLLALDLPEQAGPVLDKLMAAAPSPAGRAGFGARLAALRLHEDDAKGALAALVASADPTVSAPAAASEVAPLPASDAAHLAAPSTGPAAEAAPAAAPVAAPGAIPVAAAGVASDTAAAAAPGAAPVVAALAAPSAAALAGPLPAPLVERRTLLMAATQARLGDTPQAVAELAALGTAAADLARATILEQAKDWPGAEHALTDYVGKTLPPTGALDQEQQQVLVRYATAAAQAGDETTLALLRAGSGPRMPNGAFGDMFRLLTAAPVQASADLPRAVRETVLAHDLPKALDALKPPTGTP